MKVLLDTQTLLWIVTQNSQLSAVARDIYLDEDNEILLSMASIWELALKISLNKLTMKESLPEFVQNHVKANDIKILNIELPHILALEKLPWHHRNPFDRIIISQSMKENIPILSANEELDFYSVTRIW
jgi:PIN domain nuclease of toxin-antitoxin system